MTPFHKLLKEAILTPCLEATRLQREPNTAKSPAALRVEKYLQGALSSTATNQYSPDALMLVAGVAGAILGEEIQFKKGKAGLIIRPLAICKTEDKFYIVTTPAPYFLDTNGNQFQLGGRKSDLQFASDEEVEKCIDTLTHKQQRAVITLPAFKPFVSSIFVTEEEEEDGVNDILPSGGTWREAQQPLRNPDGGFAHIRDIMRNLGAGD